MWNLRFKTRETNQALYSQHLIDCMLSFNFNPNCDDAILESLKELVSLENTMIEHDEAQLMELLTPRKIIGFNRIIGTYNILMNISIHP